MESLPPPEKPERTLVVEFIGAGSDDPFDEVKRTAICAYQSFADSITPEVIHYFKELRRESDSWDDPDEYMMQLTILQLSKMGRIRRYRHPGRPRDTQLRPDEEATLADATALYAEGGRTWDAVELHLNLNPGRLKYLKEKARKLQ